MLSLISAVHVQDASGDPELEVVRQEASSARRLFDRTLQFPMLHLQLASLCSVPSDVCAVYLCAQSLLCIVQNATGDPELEAACQQALSARHLFTPPVRVHTAAAAASLLSAPTNVVTDVCCALRRTQVETLSWRQCASIALLPH